MSTYTLIKKLIDTGKTEGLSEKIDVFFACERITQEQYTELISLLEPKETKESGGETDVAK